jgi:hypothetical protein
MKLRVKTWYVKELELDCEIARSTMPVDATDGHGCYKSDDLRWNDQWSSVVDSG